jgi:hypothetical protein
VTERIAPERVRKVTLETPNGRIPLFEGKALADAVDGRFACDTPGTTQMLLEVEEAGQMIPTKISWFVGQELRLVNPRTLADHPVMELEVGGVLPPLLPKGPLSFDGLEVLKSEWNENSRRLRLHLKSSPSIGDLHRIRIRTQWSNRLWQDGPEIDCLTFEPRIDWQPTPARVGLAFDIDVPSSPAPIAARVGGKIADWGEGRLRFTPAEPGSQDVEFDYHGFHGTETRIVGTIDVQPVAELRLPEYSERGESFAVQIASIDLAFHGRELVLQIGERESGRWIAGPAPQELTATAGDLVGPLRVEVKDGTGVVLCRGSVEILAGLTLDELRSLPVTTADGAMAAEFAWLGMKGGDRDLLASAFASAGFRVGWRDNILLATGNSAT